MAFAHIARDGWRCLQFPFIVIGMKIDLPADQKRWLESEVASGRFASIGEAVEMAIAGLMTDVPA